MRIVHDPPTPDTPTAAARPRPGLRHKDNPQTVLHVPSRRFSPLEYECTLTVEQWRRLDQPAAA